MLYEVITEASRIALKYMTPVILLTDGYVANGSEPWRVPDLDTIPELEVKLRTDPEGFFPYRITSYNVCYTKLLRGRWRARARHSRRPTGRAAHAPRVQRPFLAWC